MSDSAPGRAITFGLRSIAYRLYALPLVQLEEPETYASGKQEAMKELPMVGVQGRLEDVRQ